jgi:hypothetical protein
MKDSGVFRMIRIVLPLWPLWILAGCGAPESPREVPITHSSHPPSEIDTHAATKAPRAIATH